MATLDIFTYQTVTPRNVEALHLRDFYGSIIGASTPTLLSLGDAPYSWYAYITGTGFTYDSNSQLQSGTVTRLEWHINSQVDYTFSFPQGVSAQAVTQWMINDSTVTALQTIFSGADTLRDGNEPGALHGYVGNDTIYGESGGDTLFGDDGNDTIYGGVVPGVLSTASHTDSANYLRGDNGDDVIYGGIVFDDINGNRGNDTCYGGVGNDWVVGGQDQDLLYGEDGADIVYGNLGDDTVYGGNGDDWVRGGQGDDVVEGGVGSDWLWGDRGNDTVVGGAGADIFHTFNGAGLDRVTDFNGAAGDRIIIDDKVAYAVTGSSADTVITLASGDVMVLTGVSLANFSSNWISVA